jgi:monoamine oxidase
MAKHILIVGAGAAGLMAARELSQHGARVTVLEARERIGGRIHTIYDSISGQPLEFGAEFIHGDSPHTMKVVKQAGLKYHKAGGDMWEVKGDHMERNNDIIEHWDEFYKQLKQLKTDKTINEFLEEHFSGPKYEGLRHGVYLYASGYDTADPSRASMMELGKEWVEGEGAKQYRLDGGYQHLINYLGEEIVKNGGRIVSNQVVKSVNWLEGFATVVTTDGQHYVADKVVITVPAAVLAAEQHQDGAITFAPALPHIHDAIKCLGVGSIIKILLRFKETFWLREETTKTVGRKLDKMEFIFSREAIPTWWTQHPNTLPLMTGWLGGLPAREMLFTSEEAILEAAISSLANIFKMPVDELSELLASWKVLNWTADPYCRGSYTYPTMDTETGRKVLGTPVADTLYFAGEALYEGTELGTVEAALSSGAKVAEDIIAKL